MAELAPPNAPIASALTLSENMELELDEAAMKSLAFREVNVKEAFTLVDATGTFFRASLLTKDADRGRAVAYERMQGSPESPLAITLVCAVLGRQRMIFVAQKATELGAVRIVPVLSEHSVKPRDLDHEKPWAWPGQAIKASRQCRRASVPEVLNARPLTHAVTAAFVRGAAARFFLDDKNADAGSATLDRLAQEGSSARAVVLAVGPEGGWSDSERSLLVEHQFQPLRLGTRILRAETAVVTGLAVLQHRLGDLGTIAS